MIIPLQKNTVTHEHENIKLIKKCLFMKLDISLIQFLIEESVIPSLMSDSRLNNTIIKIAMKRLCIISIFRNIVHQVHSRLIE